MSELHMSSWILIVQINRIKCAAMQGNGLKRRKRN